VGDQRGQRADREAGSASQRVAGEDDDVGGRLDVGERGESDPAGDRQRRQGGDQGDDLGRRPRALVPGEAGEQDGAEDEEAGQLPAHRSRLASANAAAPASAVITPGRSSTRATSVAKYQPPERICPAVPSAIAAPSPSRTTRSAKAAANSTSW